MCEQDTTDRSVSSPGNDGNSLRLLPSPESAESTSLSDKRRRRHVVSNACQACKRRKTKCDGGPGPCEACLQRQSDCTFSTETDQRRSQAKKHKAQEAEHYRELSGGLLEAIRNSEDAQVRELINVIRSNASLNEILACVNKCLEQAQKQEPDNHNKLEELEDLRTEAETIQGIASDSRRRRKVMGVLELAKSSPLFEVPAKPWTNITDDDQMVSELLSLFFTWFNPFWTLIDQVPFVRAMKSADLSTRLCTKFLVKSMLAVSFLLTSNPPKLDTLDPEECPGHTFYKEARRLWLEEEEGKQSLTNVQGLSLLVCFTSISGHDKLGWSTMGQLHNMYEDLELSKKIPNLKVPDLEKADLSKSLRIVSWSVFNLTSTFSRIYLKPPRLDIPTIGLPFDDNEVEIPDLWSPYPEYLPRLAPQRLNFNKLCELTKICWHTKALFSIPNGSTEFQDMRELAENLMIELTDWYEQMPKILHPRPNLEAFAVELHINYFISVLTLLDFLRKPEIIALATSQDPEYAITMDKRIVSLVLNMMPMQQIFHTAYGLSNATTFVLQGAIRGIFALMNSLEDNENRSAFSELVIVLAAGAQHRRLYRGILGMIRPTARELGVNIPPDIDQQLRFAEKGLWKSGEYKRYRSMYPNYIFAKDSSGEDDYTLGDLLDKWGSLRVDEESEN